MTRPGARARRSRYHRSDLIFLGILGGVALVAMVSLVIWLAGPDQSFKYDESFRVSWAVVPAWEEDARQHEPLVASRHRSLEIYLDVSEPVGGFFPPPQAAEEFSDFRALVNLIPDLLVQVAGTTDSPIQWYGVASQTRSLAGRPGLTNAGLFNGGETRLDHAIDDMVRGLNQGDVEVAALVTDLVATEELIGAMGAAKALSDWMYSNPVRNGELGAGLLGVKARYWGVRKPTCRGAGDLGCWFSEQAGEYRPLREVVKKPFYVLILGRNLDKVDLLGQELQKRAGRFDLEAQWELLSGASRSRSEQALCQTRGPGSREERQFTLRRAPDGTFKCLQEEVVEVTCSLPAGLEKGAWQARASWEGVSAEVQSGKVQLTVDCGRLQSEVPHDDLVLTLEGEPGEGWSEEWQKWSAETDEREEEIGRTLRLEEFIQKIWLRPYKVVATSGVVLKGKRP